MAVEGAAFGVAFSSTTTIGSHHVDVGDENQDWRGHVVVEATGALVLALCDGHGEHGGEIARRVGDQLLHGCREELLKGATAEIALSRTFDAAGTSVDALPSATSSGTTATVTVLDGTRLVCGFVGDSQACLLRLEENTATAASPSFLFEGHRPANEDEATRILASGCTIDSQYVIGKASHGGNILALTRAFGDKDMRHCNVHSTPDIFSVPLPSDVDSLLVLASDGFWEGPCTSLGDVQSTAKRDGTLQAPSNCQGRTRT